MANAANYPLCGISTRTGSMENLTNSQRQGDNLCRPIQVIIINIKLQFEGDILTFYGVGDSLLERSQPGHF